MSAMANTNVGLVNEDRRTFWCAEMDPKKFAHRLRYRIDAYRKWLKAMKQGPLTPPVADKPQDAS